MSSSTRAMFVSGPWVQSLGLLVNTLTNFIHRTEFPVILWARSHYRLRSVALFTLCLNPHFIGWRHFAHIGTILKVILKTNYRNLNHKIIQHVIVYKITLLMTSLSVSRYSSFGNNGGVFRQKFYCKNFLSAQKSLGGITGISIILRQLLIPACRYIMNK